MSDRLLTIWVEDLVDLDDERDEFRVVYGYCGENARDGFTEYVKRSDYAKLEAERDWLRGAIVKWARAERNYNHSFYMPSKVMIFDESDPLGDEPIVGGEELHCAVNELYEMADLGPCDCYVCKRIAALEEGGDDE